MLTWNDLVISGAPYSRKSIHEGDIADEVASWNFAESDWILTREGVDFPVRRPVGGWTQFRLNDIAHALAHLCRFNGHCLWHYSVAEHSVLVALRVIQISIDLGYRGSDINRMGLAGLFHDGTEAYMVDIPSPWKRLGIFAEYRKIEHSMTGDLFSHFDCEVTDNEYRIIKRADLEMLAIEARDVMGPSKRQWLLPVPTMRGRDDWSLEPEVTAVHGEFQAGMMTRTMANQEFRRLAARLGVE